MKKTQKRVISIVMTLLMVLSLIPSGVVKAYAAEGDASSALINYPTVADGVVAGTGGTCEKATVKINLNKTEVSALKFANSYTTDKKLNANYFELSVDGGFKAGDIVSIAGCFNNSDDTKVTKVDLFAVVDGEPVVLFTTKQFINGRNAADSPEAETYTLGADYDKLYLGRNGGTTTYVTELKVERSKVEETTPEETTPEETTPEETTPEETTASGETSPAETTAPEETSPAETTAPEETTPAETTAAETTPIAAGTYDFIPMADIDAVNAIVGLTTSNVDKHSSHGVTTNGGTITLNLEKNANVVVTECRYGTAPITANVGTVEYTVEAASDVDGVYTIKGASGELVISFESGTRGYIHSVAVEYVEPTIAAGTYDFINMADIDAVNAIVGLSTDKVDKHSSHGVTTNGGKITLNLEKNANVVVTECRYGTAPITTNVGKVDYTVEATSDVDGVYTIKGATGELVISFESGTRGYIHSVAVEYVDPADIPEQNGVPYASFYDWNFSDGSVLSADVAADSQLNGSVTSKDGFLTLTSAGTMYTHDTQHGLAIAKGDTFEVKVAGDATVTFQLCQYGTPDGSIKGSTKKGELAEKSIIITDGKNDGLTTAAFHYTGVATTLTFTVDGPAAEYYLHGISVSNNPAPTETPVLVGNGQTDVWDFGGAVLEGYNNMISVDDINALFPGVEPGTKGVTTGNFDLKELVFRCGGRTNNRIRTTNTAITRYDDKDKTIDGTKYAGYIYSNNASPVAYVGLQCYPNDVITLVMGSNGGASTIYFESPSGVIQEGASNGDGVVLTFYATEFGEYKIYSTDEKLVLYRAYREHTAPTTVSGAVDATAATGIGDYQLLFTCEENGQKTVVDVAGGAYTTTLYSGYTYTASLLNANGYVISSETSLTVGNAAIDFPITIESVDLVTVTGKLAGLSADALAKLKLSFVNESAIYVPTFTVDGEGNISVALERGVEYAIVADGVNDYYLSGITSIQKTENATQDIEFTLKPVYNVAVNFEGLPEAAAQTAIATFTNINEEGYSYSFPVSAAISLRDGQYSVVVTGTGSAACVQKVTPNAKVNGADTSITVPFMTLSNWDFSKYNGAPGIETIGENKYYLGLGLAPENVLENKIYLLVNAGGTVTIPTKAGDIVTVQYCYCSDFNLDGETSVKTNTGSTSTIETTTYVAKGDTVTINGVGQTYFTGISVATAIPYAPQIFVGADKDFKTVNAALDYVAKMDRENNARVEIVIDPGNYEEMLRVNVPNVSLVNAAGENASIQLTNKGVDIAENAVRITSYYGHGYNYYSMGANSLYDEDVLKANQANGYLSNENVGSGTTNNSYWNATVVVYANGFEAEGIIFENSFNQYISAKEAADTVVCWATGSKGVRPTAVGDTSVQNKSFVERAAAMSIIGDKAAFKNCKFIGRQDTLYGGTSTTAVFDKCDILGGTDYIFGGMKAVFNKCYLRMNTSAASTDVAYITAAQQAGGRGYLMDSCIVTSTTPGVDTASENLSKPGFFGRPWAGKTSEVVYINTTVETTDFPGSEGKSLIQPAAWDASLGGDSPFMMEYNTKELSGEDNSAKRVSWAKVLETPFVDDGATEITREAYVGGAFVEYLTAKGYFADVTPVNPTRTTGLFMDETGAWNYYIDGVLASDYTGLVYDEVVGWWYVENGAITFAYNGLVLHNDAWWCVCNSMLVFDYAGLWYDEVVGWWYVNNGMIDFEHNGLVLYGDSWYCVCGGMVVFTYTGLWYDEVVGWWYVENGVIDFTQYGLTYYNDAWWCVAGGTVAFDYTGLWYDELVGWWYVKGGMIDFSFSGSVEYDGNMYNVVNGAVCF